MSTILTEIKKYDKAQKDWDKIHPATSGTITQVGKEIEVKGKAIGAYAVGDKIKLGDNIADVIAHLVQQRIAATYAAPTEAIAVASGTAKGTYEVGTAVDATIRATFTKHDAGDITSHKINDGTSDVVTGTTNPAEYKYTATLGEGTVTFTATCAYGQGALKKDNLGDDSPAGRIPAGSKTATLAYTGIRKGFYGADSTSSDALATSADIRKLTASSGALKKGSTFTMTIPKGSKKCTIAFDKAIGTTISKVLYVEGSNTNVVGQFAFATVAVEGANGFASKDYTVATLAWAQPTAAAMTFNVTL